MKSIFFVSILFLFCSKAVGQESETLTEEKSSAWLRIAAPATNVQKAPVTVRRKPVIVSKAPTKKSTPPQKTTSAATPPKNTDEFNKTNNKVKRFQKD